MEIKAEHPDILPDKTTLIRNFQRRYGLTNRDMAQICGCSLPTIQKWRSGEVSMAAAARNLIKLLDTCAGGDLEQLKKTLIELDEKVHIEPVVERPPEVEGYESVVEAMDKLELMLQNRRKDRELQEAEARYRSILDAMEEPVCRWLPDTTLTYVNAAYAAIYAEAGSDLIGRRWLEFIPPEQRMEVESFVWDVVRTGEPHHNMHESLSRTGQRMVQQWRDIPIKDEKGRVIEVHSHAVDRTEIKALQGQLALAGGMRRTFFRVCTQAVVLFDVRGAIEEATQAFWREYAMDGHKHLSALIVGAALNDFLRRVRLMSEGEVLVYHVPLKEGNASIQVESVGEAHNVRLYAGVMRRHAESFETELSRVRLQLEGLVSKHISPRAVDESAQLLLRSMRWIGETLNVSRVYAFRFEDDFGCMSNTHEWSAPEVEPCIDELQHLSVASYPWWVKRLREGQWIRVEDVAHLSRAARNEQALLRAQGIAAVLVAPVMKGGNCLGYVGFDYNTQPRKWHEQDEAALESLVLIVKSHFSGELG